MSRTIRIGCGAGFSGDRIDPAVELAEHGQLDYLIFECLAERTIALAQQARLSDPDAGFDPYLGERMRAVLPQCVENGTRIVTNMGAANPVQAGRTILAIARELGLNGLRIAMVTGDDLLDWLCSDSSRMDWCEDAPRPDRARIISANAYLGARPIVDALAMRADVVVTGRVSDPALVLGPLMHEFDWQETDWSMLGKATLAGHLIECAGQVTGGYFAVPGQLDVPDLHRIGYPIAEFREDGDLVITKVAGSGGRVSRATCIQQMLYEVHDPACYLTPDVSADFSAVEVIDLGEDRVRLLGAGGRPAPDKLKLTIGYRDGYIGEGQISYAGPGTLARARLAQDIVRRRLERFAVDCTELRCDYIGLNSVSGLAVEDDCDPPELRLRMSARAATREAATRIGAEVEGLYTCGPAGGGGVSRSVREVIAATSALVDREVVQPQVEILEA